MHAHKVLAAPMGADKVVREFGEAAGNAAVGVRQPDTIVFKVLEHFRIFVKNPNSDPLSTVAVILDVPERRLSRNLTH